MPLYLVSLPCLADSTPTPVFGGSFSTLQDLSLARLLRALDSSNVSVASLIAIQRREDSSSDPFHLRARVITLTVLALVVALLPALYKIIKEFNRLVSYRQRWIEFKCDGLEMGWLSTTKAPGFVGWGEKQLKDFLLKSGLSSSLDKNSRNGRRTGRNGARERRRSEDQPLDSTETANLEVDIRNLFSVVSVFSPSLHVVTSDILPGKSNISPL